MGTGVRVGLGYNPALPTSWCPSVRYLEAGPGLFASPSASKMWKAPGRTFSLHLSRAPFCENESVQRHYLSWVAELVTATKLEVESIGMHLCGPLRDELGALGIGPEFRLNKETERSSRRFVEMAQYAISMPILIENANFYESKPRDTVSTVEYTSQLCDGQGVSQILDLAHLVMSARNCGLNEQYLLGHVRFPAVTEIHLSGMRMDDRGLFHDAHNLPVHEELWSLAATLPSVFEPRREVTVVLEHTDPAWGDDQPAFARDTERLLKLAEGWNAGIIKRQPVDLNRVGTSYLANVVLSRRHPEILEFVGQERFRALVSEWVTDLQTRNKGESARYVYFDHSPVCATEGVLDASADFGRFASSSIVNDSRS